MVTNTFLFCIQNGGTALHVASYNGHCEVVGVLLEANADVNIEDKVSHFIVHIYTY